MPGKHRLYLHCPGEACLCAATSSPPCWLACARCQGMAAPSTKGTTSCNLVFQHLPKAHSAAAGAADSAALPELQGCLRSRLRRTLLNLARSLTSTSLRACECFPTSPQSYQLALTAAVYPALPCLYIVVRSSLRPTLCRDGYRKGYGFVSFEAAETLTAAVSLAAVLSGGIRAAPRAIGQPRNGTSWLTVSLAASMRN